VTPGESADLDRMIIATRYKVIAGRMEGNRIHLFGMCIVMLQKSTSADIPELNGAITPGRCDQCSIRTETNRLDSPEPNGSNFQSSSDHQCATGRTSTISIPCVIVERVDVLSSMCVPKSNCFVIAARDG